MINMKKRNYIILFLALLVSCALGIIFGSVKIEPEMFIKGLVWSEDALNQSIIIYHLRIPRVLAGLLAGVGLSISGVLLQSVTGNDLAGPNIIGVNAGAGFFCILMLSFFPTMLKFLPIAAFTGAFLTTLLILLIVKKVNSKRSTVILAGIAVTTLLNAGISFLSLLDSDVLASYNSFSIGGLRGAEIDELIVPGIIIAVCFIISLLFSRQTHLLCLGDSVASSLGVKTKTVRFIGLICASASAAAVVSFAGLLGFVGLVVPHISRRICGSEQKNLLITSGFVGAILVIIADLVGRVLLAPTEIPVGILMAVLGAPFFLFLLIRRRTDND
ncbi:MAG: iron ABC transporter permease [Clostridia bacterium]|nr:iron ABC transporter permease [Clostridia bacterium]